MLVLVLALAMTQNDLANNDRGSALYRDCQVAQRYAIGQTRHGDDPSSEFRCVDYMTRFLNAKATANSICVGDFAIKDFIGNYIAYMGKNRKLMHDHKIVGVLGTYKAYSSCAL
jgi:hypothetical protein